MTKPIADRFSSIKHSRTISLISLASLMCSSAYLPADAEVINRASRVVPVSPVARQEPSLPGKIDGKVGGFFSRYKNLLPPDSGRAQSIQKRTDGTEPPASQQLQHFYFIGKALSPEQDGAGSVDNKIAPKSLDSEKAPGASSAQTNLNGKHGDAQIYTMQPGSMLLMHDSPILLQTENGSVLVTKGTMAFVVQIGQDVAVYNLTGTKYGAVIVKTGSQTIPVLTGNAMILSQTANDLSQCPLSQCISLGHSAKLGTERNVSLYKAEFSYESALYNCPQFQQFVRSSNRVQRKTAEVLIKYAAASALAPDALAQQPPTESKKVPLGAGQGATDFVTPTQQSKEVVAAKQDTSESAAAKQPTTDFLAAKQDTSESAAAKQPTPTPVTNAKADIEQAKQDETTGKLLQAAQEYNDAAQAYSAANDYDAAGRAYDKAGQAYAAIQKSAAAAASYQNAGGDFNNAKKYLAAGNAYNNAAARDGATWTAAGAYTAAVQDYKKAGYFSKEGAADTALGKTLNSIPVVGPSNASQQATQAFQNAAKAYAESGRVNAKAQNPAKAAAAYESAAASYAQGNNIMEQARCLNQAGNMYQACGNHGGAVVAWDTTESLYQSVGSADVSAGSYAQGAKAYSEAAKNCEAHGYYAEANTINCCAAGAYGLSGDFKEAGRLYDNAAKYYAAQGASGYEAHCRALAKSAHSADLNNSVAGKFYAFLGKEYENFAYLALSPNQSAAAAAYQDAGSDFSSSKNYAAAGNAYMKAANQQSGSAAGGDYSDAGQNYAKGDYLTRAGAAYKDAGTTLAAANNTQQAAQAYQDAYNADERSAKINSGKGNNPSKAASAYESAATAAAENGKTYQEARALQSASKAYKAANDDTQAAAAKSQARQDFKTVAAADNNSGAAAENSADKVLQYYSNGNSSSFNLSGQQQGAADFDAGGAAYMQAGRSYLADHNYSAAASAFTNAASCYSKAGFFYNETIWGPADEDNNPLYLNALSLTAKAQSLSQAASQKASAKASRRDAKDSSQSANAASE